MKRYKVLLFNKIKTNDNRKCQKFKLSKMVKFHKNFKIQRKFNALSKLINIWRLKLEIFGWI